MENTKQVVVCHKGRCSEEGVLEKEFESLFNNSNIVDQIQHDLTNNILK